MAHWKDAAVTNDGVEMLNEWMAGRKITIVAAYGGTGTVDPELLREQTDLVDPRQKLCLLGEEDGADGKTVQLQVSNAELAEEYELTQVGVFAALDVERDPEAPRRLLFIMQDGKGVTVPAALDGSYLLELYCLIGITNNGRFEVSISAAGIVTAAYLREALERAIAGHNGDGKAHTGAVERLCALEAALNGKETIYRDGDPTAETAGTKGQHYINRETGTEWVCTGVTEDGYLWKLPDGEVPIRQQIDQVSAGSAGMEIVNADLEARLSLLELMYRTQVNGNPFTVSFGDMTGLVVTGVWNAAMKRVEF